MSKTIVGLFKTKAEAENVKHELVSRGYSAADIRVVADNTSSYGTAGETPYATTTGVTSTGAAMTGPAVTSPAMTGSTAGSATTGDTHSGTGFGATISNFFRSLTGGDDAAEHHYTEGVRQGGALLSVVVPDGKEHETADLLESYGATGVEDQRTAQGSTAASGQNLTESGSVPVVEETLQVGKRAVQRGGVRIYSHLVEEPVTESINLREEHVRIDRQPVNRAATEADFTGFKEGTIELTETAEEAVVAKNARVVEEIVVGKETSERTETIHDTVRHTEVEVEQLGTGTNATKPALTKEATSSK